MLTYINEDGGIDFTTLQRGISNILIKEGIHNNIKDVHMGCGYKRTLGGALIELGQEVDQGTGKAFIGSAVLLIDLMGEKVIGGGIPAWFTTQISLGSYQGIMCNNADYSQSSLLGSYILLTWHTSPFTLEPPINKDKPDEEFTPYDKFIRKLVYLNDLYQTLHSYGGLGYHVRKYVDSYGPYMDEFKHMKERVIGELDDILNNYPQEFVDVD